MKVLVTGASGFVGTRMVERLRAAGHEPLRVSRGPTGDFDWSDSSLRQGVNEADGIIHLAGENLFAKRWSAEQKDVLVRSRLDTTRRLAELAAERKSRCFVSTSAIGFYGASDARDLDENTPRGGDFLAKLCDDWEEALQPARDGDVRTATVRAGVVLGMGGGALLKMLPPFRMGVGGPLGSGKQWVSWIHRDDLVSLYIHLLENPSAEGVYNGTAPNPVRMGELAKTLGRVLHRPALFPVPGFVLRLALGEVADLLLTGQHVLPKRALGASFEFNYPDLEPALAQLVRSG